MDADGSNECVLAAGTGTIALSPQPWAPDGSRIAWGGGDVYTVNAAGGDIRQLTFDGNASAPAWSPTGSTLVYSHYNGRWALFVVGADGSGPTQITPHDQDENPTWSPNGDSIVFTRHYVVHTIHPDGTGLRQVQSAGGVVLWPPAWSPDGSKIAYQWLQQTGRYTYTGGTDVVDADGRNLKQLQERGSNLSWSPDGDRILFLGRGGLMTMNASGTCPVMVNQDDVRDMPSWQPVPGGPNVGQAHCHAISLGVEAVTINHSAAASVTATVVNEGTEPVTNVTLVGTSSSDASPAISPSSGEGCSIRLRRVTCRFSRLEVGASHSFSMRFEARVVGLLLRNTDVEGFQVSASEQLIRTYRTSGESSFAIKRCTNRDRGAGTIYGTYMPEKLCGRRGADQIHPGQGNDVVDAGAGNDVIFARDRTFDRISCGPGRDTVVADRRDHVARDCEVVRRR